MNKESFSDLPSERLPTRLHFENTVRVLNLWYYEFYNLELVKIS